MSRDSLLNTSCNIYRISHTTDAYGQPIETRTFIATESCAFMHLRGTQPSVLGHSQARILCRIYLQNNSSITLHDYVEFDEKRWEVIWINPLSYQTGLTSGVQVDLLFLGYCEEYLVSSSSSTSSIDSSSSSTSISSSSSTSLSSSSSSYSSSSTSSSTSSEQYSISSSSSTSSSSYSSSSYSSSSSSTSNSSTSSSTSSSSRSSSSSSSSSITEVSSSSSSTSISSSSSSSSADNCPNNIDSIIASIIVGHQPGFVLDTYHTININFVDTKDKFVQMYIHDTTGYTPSNKVFYGAEQGSANKYGWLSLIINGETYYMRTYSGDATTDCTSNIIGDDIHTE